MIINYLDLIYAPVEYKNIKNSKSVDVRNETFFAALRIPNKIKNYSKT